MKELVLVYGSHFKYKETQGGDRTLIIPKQNKYALWVWSAVADRDKAECVENILRSPLGHIQTRFTNTGYVKVMRKLWIRKLTYLPLVRIYVSVNRASIGSGNGLSPIRRQAII